MTGSIYSLTGGFWSLISWYKHRIAVTHELLSTSQLLNRDRFVAEHGQLHLAAEFQSGQYVGLDNHSIYAITTNNGTDSITITQPVGNLFFGCNNSVIENSKPSNL